MIVLLSLATKWSSRVIISWNILTFLLQLQLQLQLNSCSCGWGRRQQNELLLFPLPLFQNRGRGIHGRRGGELSRISPPQKNFEMRFPPFVRGTLWQNIPPLRKNFALIQRIPPLKFEKNWQFLWIPPLNLINFSGSPPWRRWLFGSLALPPLKIFQISPPRRT